MKITLKLNKQNRDKEYVRPFDFVAATESRLLRDEQNKKFEIMIEQLKEMKESSKEVIKAIKESSKEEIKEMKESVKELSSQFKEQKEKIKQQLDQLTSIGIVLIILIITTNESVRATATAILLKFIK
jgi:signal transduction histidine kinase